MKLTKGIIYDIEVMPKVFLVTCLDISTGTIRVFEVSKRRNDYFDFRRCLDDLKARDYFMVGFNNFFYDYPVVHSLLFDLELDPDLSWQDVTAKAWSKSKEVISSSMRYENVVWEKNQYLFQIDLYRLHHFDNKAKTVSQMITIILMILSAWLPNIYPLWLLGNIMIYVALALTIISGIEYFVNNKNVIQSK